MSMGRAPRAASSQGFVEGAYVDLDDGQNLMHVRRIVPDFEDQVGPGQHRAWPEDVAERGRDTEGSVYGDVHDRENRPARDGSANEAEAVILVGAGLLPPWALSGPTS
jgi:hypothetical protein